MGRTMETVTDFIFLDSKIRRMVVLWMVDVDCGWWMWTVDGDCSHEIKRRLHLGRKAMTDLDSVLKRLITLPTKV